MTNEPIGIVEKKPEKREDHHLISPTAKLVAHLRAETDIPYSKEIDQLCEAGKTTEELFGKREALSWMSAMLELRYKSLSELLKREMAEKGIKQVLELACGVQPRGLLESSNPDITYIETDLPDMAMEKKSLVQDLEPGALERENYSIAELNVLDLKQFNQVVSKFDSGSVAIINEGLLPYLSIDEKHTLAENIHNILSEKGGVWITPDISNSARMRVMISAFPGAEEAVGRLNSAVGRNIRENSIGDKETTLKFYRDLGFKITEYTQREFVPHIGSLDLVVDDEARATAESVLSESGIWVLEVEAKQ